MVVAKKIPKKIRFIRKGQIGDWKNFFTKERAEEFDAEIQTYVEKYGIKIPACE